MKTILALTLALALAGCATGQKEYYAAETARHSAEQARWTSMAEIAKTGDATTKAVAVAVMGGSRASSQATAAPVNEALQWASILIPGLTQVAGMRYYYLSNQTQSNNAASVAISTNGTLAGIAGRIQAPGATSTSTTTNTLSGTGNLGSGTYATTDNTSIPTVVNQPAPLVVNQPAPLVVNQPAPIVVNQPAPIVVNQPAPIVVHQNVPTL
jgi:hypothetical protein